MQCDLALVSMDELVSCLSYMPSLERLFVQDIDRSTDTKVAAVPLNPNTPDNMVRWLQNPPAIDPRSAMPNMGISEAQARDIAAWLYTME